MADAVWQTQNNGEYPAQSHFLLRSPTRAAVGGHGVGGGPASCGTPRKPGAVLQQGEWNGDQTGKRIPASFIPWVQSTFSEHLFRCMRQKREITLSVRLPVLRVTLLMAWNLRNLSEGMMCLLCAWCCTRGMENPWVLSAETGRYMCNFCRRMLTGYCDNVQAGDTGAVHLGEPSERWERRSHLSQLLVEPVV